ncbi:hypothetical protein HYC85_002964 [Camellia sinensis]|uniref:Uncharacterized protein n=1 Tax=Camellia sinensis TaxID=4442 RepID=A0A7J7IA46_CAMSI|nr:hypothetical protein HYC85_002964 [Camellia sinensis]
MAGTEPQKQLLTLIRDFASEKSQGERRIVCLKNRTQQLRSELDLANSELEDAKRLKETTEQELKGYEVELAMNEAFIQTLETRISLIQDEISIAGSDLESIKIHCDFLPKAGQKLSDAEDPEVSRRDLDNKIAEIISQTTVEEQECQADQTIHKQVTSEFEERCASLGEELQRRCICPSCHLDNVEALDGILQASDGN